MHGYTFKGGTVIRHKSMLNFSNFVTKHFSNNKDAFKAKSITVNGDCNSDLVNASTIIACPLRLESIHDLKCSIQYKDLFDFCRPGHIIWHFPRIVEI